MIEVEDRTLETGDWTRVEDWSQYNDDERIHVMPVYEGEREHETHPSCWCQPGPSELDDRIIVHRRMAEA